MGYLASLNSFLQSRRHVWTGIIIILWAPGGRATGFYFELVALKFEMIKKKRQKIQAGFEPRPFA